VAAQTLDSRADPRRVARGSAGGLATGDTRSHPESLRSECHRPKKKVDHARTSCVVAKWQLMTASPILGLNQDVHWLRSKSVLTGPSFAM
jgi:hypothetical protein